MKKIGIIILHFGDVKHTKACLHSLKKAKKTGIIIKIFLVDNGTGTFFKKEKNIHIIRNIRNLGFAAGINVGIKEALKDKSIDNVLILNNDTRINKEFFVNLQKKLFDITGVVIKFKNNKGKWIFDYGGKVNYWTGKTKHIEKDSLYLASNISDQDYFSGCCLLIKKEVLKKIGYLDERFFFYYEDVDFCIRAKKAGFIVGLNPNAVLEHKLSSSIGRWSSKAIYFNLKGNFKFINKHLGIKKPIAWLHLSLLTAKIIVDRINQNEK